LCSEKRQEWIGIDDFVPNLCLSRQDPCGFTQTGVWVHAPSPRVVIGCRSAHCVCGAGFWVVRLWAPKASKSRAGHLFVLSSAPASAGCSDWLLGHTPEVYISAEECQLWGASLWPATLLIFRWVIHIRDVRDDLHECYPFQPSRHFSRQARMVV